MKKMLIVVFIMTTLVFSQTFAQEIGLKGVGGKIGFIMPDGDIENTIGLGLQADLGQYNENISIAAYLDYWGKDYSLGTNYEWNWSVVSIAAIGKYEFEPSGNFTPFAGAGIGLDFASWESKYTGPTNGLGSFAIPSASASDTDFAIHFVGGATMELSPKIEGIGEVKYTLGGADYFGIYIGVMYKLDN
jgi:opacity protein-like surface antigen